MISACDFIPSSLLAIRVLFALAHLMMTLERVATRPLEFSLNQKAPPQLLSLRCIQSLRVHAIILACRSDLHLELVDRALHLWLRELLDLLHDNEEVFSHVSAVSQPILVAALVVLNEPEEDLL